jgi:AcrR family transcriptional regulator/DNA-binding MarR family transcriptional regulator
VPAFALPTDDDAPRSGVGASNGRTARARRAVPDRRQGAHVSEMQRRRLLLAAGELLGERGIEATSVGAVCKRAGVSRRTFYEEFDDGEACFLEALDEAVERLAREVVPAYAGGERWSVRVRAALTALLEHFDAHPGVARMCVVETLRGGPRVLERRRELVAALVAAVDQGRAHAKPGDAPLPLSAEGAVGGALAVIHARLHTASSPPAFAAEPQSLAELANPLTAMIVHPYLGSAVARRELERPTSKPAAATAKSAAYPFQGVSIRFTYRTARVLATIASQPGANNRMIAGNSGIGDEGQMSRLLRRLESAGLIENRVEAHGRGEPNAWWLTERGEGIHATLAGTDAVPG